MSNRELSPTKMEAIRKNFVKVLESPNGDSFQALVDGSHALRELHPNMTIREAAAVLTDWAIQDGYFEAEQRARAEEIAEKVIAAA